MYFDHPYYCCDNHKSVFTCMALTIDGCFTSKTCHVTALGWLKKERKEKINNSKLCRDNVIVFNCCTVKTDV